MGVALPALVVVVFLGSAFGGCLGMCGDDGYHAAWTEPGLWDRMPKEGPYNGYSVSRSEGDIDSISTSKTVRGVRAGISAYPTDRVFLYLGDHPLSQQERLEIAKIVIADWNLTHAPTPLKFTSVNSGC